MNQTTLTIVPVAENAAKVVTNFEYDRHQPIIKLKNLSIERVIRFAHHKLKDQYIDVPLWEFIRECCFLKTPTEAIEICRQLGFNPYANAVDELPKSECLQLSGFLVFNDTTNTSYFQN